MGPRSASIICAAASSVAEAIGVVASTADSSGCVVVHDLRRDMRGSLLPELLRSRNESLPLICPMSRCHSPAAMCGSEYEEVDVGVEAVVASGDRAADDDLEWVATGTTSLTTSFNQCTSGRPS